MRRDSHRAIATDAEGHELRVNDNVKEVDGLVNIVSYFLSMLIDSFSHRAARAVSCILTNHSSLSCIIEIMPRTAASS